MKTKSPRDPEGFASNKQKAHPMNIIIFKELKRSRIRNVGSILN
jgi:hypothetical protein